MQKRCVFMIRTQFHLLSRATIAWHLTFRERLHTGAGICTNCISNRADVATDNNVLLHQNEHAGTSSLKISC